MHILAWPDATVCAYSPSSSRSHFESVRPILCMLNRGHCDKYCKFGLPTASIAARMLSLVTILDVLQAAGST